MKLEKWSWVAGIVAAIVAIVALIFGILTWLVDQNDFIAFCKNCGNAIAKLFSMTFAWLNHPVSWPVWALILLGVFGFIFWSVIWCCTKFTSSPDQPRSFSPFDYTTDEIDGIVWRWEYRGGKFADVLDAYCPNNACMCRLTMKSDHDRISLRSFGPGAHVVNPISFFCSKCGFKRPFNADWNKVKHEVFLELERRINTGEFQQRLTPNNPAEK